MDLTTVNLRSLSYSLLVHLACIALACLGLLWADNARPISVEGPIIEATLVDFQSTPLPIATKPPAAKPELPAAPPVEKEVNKPELAKVTTPPPESAPPPRSEDRIDQEQIRIRPDAVETADTEQKEQIKKKQVDLTNPEEELAKMERERQQQLDDIRRLREDAERKRKIEEQKLAQLQDRNRQLEYDRERELERRQAAEAAARAGNQGQENSLLEQYRLAISSMADRNWLRPDTLSEGFRCFVTVTQIPGGDVIAVDMDRCSADAEILRSVEAAVKREPLPYQGFESVFQRTVTIPFCFPREICKT